MSIKNEAPCLKEILESYRQYRTMVGLKPLVRSHCTEHLLYHANIRSQGMLTKDLLDWWWKKRETEQPQSHFARLLGVVPLLRFAADRWITPQIPVMPKKPRCVQYVPHIFTHEELVAFFQACDTIRSPRRIRESFIAELEIPVMFRLMYANGLRPNECRLLPRKCVCLKTGVINIEETKGYIQHQIVVKEDMLTLLRKYDVAIDSIIPNRKMFFPTTKDTPQRNDWLSYHFNAAWYKNNTARATAYCLRHAYVIANIYSWREQGIGYGLNDKLLTLSKSLGHGKIESTLYYFSLVPAFEGEMDDELEKTLEELTKETVL